MKRIKRLLVSLCLAALIITDPLSCVVPSTGITIQAEAATKTITVKKVNTSTAKKIHKQLLKGKAITLKISGKPSKAAKTLSKLEKKIKKVNQQGVIFFAYKTKEQGNYTYYSISADNAKLYKYSIKFVQKLYANTRSVYENLSSDVLDAYAHDNALYPDETTRKFHIYYDYTVRCIQEYAKEIFDYKKYTIKDFSSSESTEVSNIIVQGNDSATCNIVSKIKNLPTSSVYESVALIKSVNIDDNGNGVINLYSFSEFLNIENISNNVTYSNLWYMYFSETEDYTYATSPSGYSNNSGFALTVLGPAVYMLQTENFGDLSDAMKIWTIDASDYFGCHFSRPAYGMLYNYSFGNYGSGGSSAMKKLYQNKAEGVCSTFTDYEYLLFSVLDIECYARSNYNINHAWTVVKVKNSAGKVLWIPFDYGIGPAENLAVSEEVYNKYLSTESARYKLYLSGIKGAPKKKNFTTEDFK